MCVIVYHDINQKLVGVTEFSTAIMSYFFLADCLFVKYDKFAH